MPISRVCLTAILATLTCLPLLGGTARADTPYRMPPRAIAEVLDDNPETFPIQSQRLFAAIEGNGGTAHLVMLPNEAHGYLGRESIATVLAEMVDWLDRWVKGAPAR